LAEAVDQAPPEAPTADIEVRASVAIHGASVSDAIEAAEAVGLDVLSVWEGAASVWASGDHAAMAAAADQPGVLGVERNAPVRLHLDTAHLATRAEDARLPATGLLRANGTPFDGSGTSIGIIDTGVDAPHRFFRRLDGSSKVVVTRRITCLAPDQLQEPGGLFTVDLGDTAPPTGEWCGPIIHNERPVDGMHGSHVAGIAAGVETVTSSGVSVRGAAPGASLVSLELDLYYGVFGVNTALQWILDHHDDPCGDGSCPPIRVINNSWSLALGDDEHDEPTTTDLLVDALVADGVTVVFAASNDGGDGEQQSTSRESDNRTPGVLSVASYDDQGSGTRSGQLSAFSSRGKRGNPYSYPDLAAPGSNILSTCPTHYPACPVPPADRGFHTLSGTSMAAPYVAGVVALLLEADPTLTPAQIEDILEDSARPIGDGPYEADPANTSHGIAYDAGHGLVDVAAALARVLGLSIPAEGILCLPGVADEPTGDSALDPGPGAVDVTAFRTGHDAEAGALVVTVELARAEESAMVFESEYVEVELYGVSATGASTRHQLVATHDRRTGAASFNVTNLTDGIGAPQVPISGTWDEAAGRIILLLPTFLTHDGQPVVDLPAGSVVEEMTAQFVQENILGFVADTSRARCPVVIG
jgi:serine protease AprX